MHVVVDQYRISHDQTRDKGIFIVDSHISTRLQVLSTTDKGPLEFNGTDGLGGGGPINTGAPLSSNGETRSFDFHVVEKAAWKKRKANDEDDNKDLS